MAVCSWSSGDASRSVMIDARESGRAGRRVVGAVASTSNHEAFPLLMTKNALASLFFDGIRKLGLI